MRKRASTKKHNPFLYALVCALLRPYLRLMYNFSPPRQIPALPAGPILLLGSHSSNLDFLFALPLLRKKRFNAVVTSYYFNNERLAKLLRFFHCIAKEQFRADVSAIRDIRACVKNGASVLIYPEGEVNGTGRCEKPDRSIVKLCRMLDVPVYAVRTHGSYFTRPKWGPVVRRGKVTAEAAEIADAQTLRALSDAELYGRICEALESNDYAWQETAMVPFPHRRCAEGLHNMLYLCPRCGREFTMDTLEDEIFCGTCGNRGFMDKYGFLHPAGGDDVIPRTAPEWIDLQRGRIRQELAEAGEDFALREKAYLQFHNRRNSVLLEDVGEGVVTLGRNALTYEGTCNGEHVTLVYPLSTFSKLPFTMGSQFDVPNPVRYTSIRPRNPRAVEKFVLAVPVIKERANKGIPVR
ncbi:MAG TPA: 1-acyl-sn-glycerol-3-phosphate acyltransferase [Clostridia bacterium]|jgi:1-acyl-sn-glycerol-3-phosphate acyltransferase|nr:MAG: 2-acyl-glycerophospho-ethanolamine acyltransferase [Firmicutes bacterium ADurb.Bin248]HOG00427.1 1-acyl-sn-glycerol-3-phosphate acyltransferase [Clostridia bacterium]HOS18098.1 1-acyl-sn-glycerol-3-phosphate acyltransferase [Clostridia bacterium]HPK15163.1 1-acyl-sn-glycerol-3-phosphate acyltransferase [Clostridia bacterium]